MKVAITTLAAGALLSFAAHAQSVAQSIETLNTRVASLESRPAPGAAAASADGAVIVKASWGGTAANLSTIKENPNPFRKALLGQSRTSISDSLDIRAEAGDLTLFRIDGLFDKPARSISLNGLTRDISVYNSAGDKVLARFGTDTLGTAGEVTVNGTKVHDYAEVFDVSDCYNLAQGAVVSESSDGKGIQLSSQPYDPAAVGVISGAGSFQPGMRIGSRADGSTDNPVAVAGQVYVWVNSESGSISVGDLLVSSSTPGVAMRGADRNRLIGTVIGKALEPFGGEEKSLIRMLVLNR